MTETLATQVAPEGTEREFTVQARSRGRTVARRFVRHRTALIGAITFLILLLFAFLGGLFWHAGINPDYGSFEPPSAQHPFGTDQLGRDMLALIIRGTQFSLLIAAVVAVIVTVVGVTLGAIAGYLGGPVDSLVNRAVDLMLILPAIVIVGVMAVQFQGSWIMVAIFLGLTLWMTLTRVIRGMVLSLREKEFVEAAKALGASTPRIIFKHIVPNCADVIIVSATLLIAQAVLLEAALSFIGLGVRPPDTSLGLLINETQSYLPTSNAWLFWITLLFIVLISLSVNFMGDGLRDALDPKANRVRA
ncbi:ABC transporter permease [Nakamurella sp.]|uniref:ABC transporter permease n=1 Tax=Nakamurella sp. TaxID=1869182 RepID=UPI003782D8BE